MSEPTLVEILTEFWNTYKRRTDSRLKLIDSFLLYLVLVGAIQFLYCGIVGTFPFNSFLSGFLSSVGVAIFTVALRMQVDPNNRDYSGKVSPQRAFADYAVCCLLYFVVVLLFMG